MGKGRLFVALSGAFIAGDIFWQILADVLGISDCFSGWCICVELISIVAYALHTSLRGCGAKLCTLYMVFMIMGALSAQTGGIHRSSLPMFNRAEQLKLQTSQTFDIIFSETPAEDAAVIKAMCIGDKSTLSKSIKKDYQRSGASHLLALSGLHVGLIYALICAMLSIIGNSTASIIIRKIIALCTLWIYAIVTGLGSSICRAAIMITIYEIAPFVGAERNLLQALSISAFATTLYNPDAPFEIGFQLSYGAMAGICFLYPALRRLLSCRSALLQKIWDMTAISLSTQAVTAPLAALYFGSFPKYFLVTNLISIPLATIIIYCSIAAIATSHIPYINSAAAETSSWLLRLLNQIIHIIGES